jgi:hypothetical protein
VGGGELSTCVQNQPELEEDNVFVLVPAVFAEANLASHLRAVGAIGYRHVASVDWPGVSASALRGAEFRIGLRAGRF